MFLLKIIKSIYKILEMHTAGIWILLVTTFLLPQYTQYLIDGYEKGTFSEDVMKFGPLVFILSGGFFALKMMLPNFTWTKKKKEKKQTQSQIEEQARAEALNEHWTKYTTNKG